jgi:hypothetical protein
MGKYELTQRFPNFMDGLDIVVVQFDTVAELEDVEFVKQWITKPEFVRLSLARTALMVEQNDNTYWGIAFIKNLEGLPTDLSGLGLPAWKPPPPV